MTRLRRSVAVALLAAATLYPGVVPATADDADPQAPVVVDDEVTIWPGGFKTLDVLTNDSDPQGDDLDLCRLPGLTGDGPVRVFQSKMYSSGSSAGEIQVTVGDHAHGTYEFSYYVCNTTRLTPATLTVHVRPVEPVDVAPRVSRPGWLRVTNHNERSVRMLVTDPQGCKVDARGRVPAHGSRFLRVRHRSVVWVAVIGRWGDVGRADSGRLRHVPLDRKPAAVSPPGHLCFQAFARTGAAQPSG